MGTTWLKVKVRISGSCSGCALAVASHAEDPNEMYASSSGPSEPTPTDAIGPSPPPRTTGVPTAKPTSAAAPGRRPPATVVELITSGNRSEDTPAASNISGHQVPLTCAKALVPEASEGSVSRRPVIRWTTKSLARQTCAIFFHTSGSFSWTHITFGNE